MIHIDKDNKYNIKTLLVNLNRIQKISKNPFIYFSVLNQQMKEKNPVTKKNEIINTIDEIACTIKEKSYTIQQAIL